LIVRRRDFRSADSRTFSLSVVAGVIATGQVTGNYFRSLFQKGRVGVTLLEKRGVVRSPVHEPASEEPPAPDLGQSPDFHSGMGDPETLPAAVRPDAAAQGCRGSEREACEALAAILAASERRRLLKQISSKG
jgi:hypothetical protein